MSLESTQPVTEMSVRNISCGKGGQFVWLTTLSPSCTECLEILSPNLLEPSAPVKTCTGISLPFFVS